MYRPYADRTEEANVEEVVANARSIARIFREDNFQIGRESLVDVVVEISALNHLTGVVAIAHEVEQVGSGIGVDAFLAEVVYNRVTGVVRIHAELSHLLRISQELTILLHSPDDVLVGRELQCPYRAGSTLHIPRTIGSRHILAVDTLNRSCELEVNCGENILVCIIELGELGSIAFKIRDQAFLEPELAEILIKLVSGQLGGDGRLTRSRQVGVNVKCLVALSLRNSVVRVEEVPVSQHLVTNLTIFEVELVNRNRQVYPNAGLVLLVDEAYPSVNSLLVETLRSVSNISCRHELLILVCIHVTLVSSTCGLEVPKQHVSLVVPSMGVGVVIMRSVPYATECIGIGHLGSNVGLGVAHAIPQVGIEFAVSLGRHEVLTIHSLEVVHPLEVLLAYAAKLAENTSLNL